jgi:hypothetical protein
MKVVKVRRRTVPADAQLFRLVTRGEGRTVVIDDDTGEEAQGRVIRMSLTEQFGNMTTEMEVELDGPDDEWVRAWERAYPPKVETGLLKWPPL